MYHWASKPENSAIFKGKENKNQFLELNYLISISLFYQKDEKENETNN